MYIYEIHYFRQSDNRSQIVICTYAFSVKLLWKNVYCVLSWIFYFGGLLLSKMHSWSFLIL